MPTRVTQAGAEALLAGSPALRVTQAGAEALIATAAPAPAPAAYYPALGRHIDLGNPVSDHPLNAGLVAWYLPLPNNSFGSRLFDLRGRNTGTLTNGPTWASGPGAFGAVQFDGTDDLSENLTLPSGTFGGGFTTAGWVRSTATTGERCCWGSRSAGNDGFGVRVSFASFANTIGVTTWGVADAPTSITAPAGWFYLVTSYAGGTWTFHVWPGAAAYQTATAATAPAAPSANGFVVGSAHRTLSGGAFAFFGGSLSDVRVYNRALSASEAHALYDQSRRGHPDTLRRWTRRAVLWVPAGGGNVTLALAGAAATASAGTLAPTTAYALTGGAANSAAGTLGDAVAYALTGDSAATAAGTLTGAVSVALAGSAATSASGTVAPGAAQSLAGAAASSAAGALAPAVAYAPTGSAATASAGTVTPDEAGNVTLALTGSAATATAGTLAPALTGALTGSAATSAAGLLAHAVAQSLAGSAASSAAGSVTPSLLRALAGSAAAAAAGAVTASGGTPVNGPVRYEFRLPVTRRKELPGAVARRILVTTPVVRRKEF